MGGATPVSRPAAALIRAIEQGGHRVTVGDVAIATGESVASVERGLLALAVEVGGHLQVAEDGEIAYLFPSNLRAIQLSRRGWTRLRQGLRKLWALLFWLLRMSFGLVLVGLIVAVVVALIAILVLSVLRSDSDGQGDNGSPIFLGWGSFGNPFNHDHDSTSRSGKSSTGSKKQQGPKKTQQELNFFESVFSFLFGDGHPNPDLEERRWREIARLIRRHQGVVIAEQLMPYLDSRPVHLVMDELSDEEAVLPALVRFNGQPHVSPKGDLVYAFPDLQVTARLAKGSGPEPPPDEVPEAADPLAANDPPFLREHPWRFSRASPSQQVTAGALGVVLLVLASLLAQAVPGHAALLIGWTSLLSGLATVGMVYGAAFLLVPLLRRLWLLKRNKGVSERNALRRGHAFRLAQGSFAVQRKLAYALTHANQRRVDANALAYTSETDLIRQEARNPTKLNGE